MHDGLLSGSLEAIDVNTWSKNKFLTFPKRIDSGADDFTIIGKTFFARELFETERRFFGDTEDITFVESRENCDMSLSFREKSILLLDKIVCCSKSVFSSANYWREAQDAL